MIHLYRILNLLLWFIEACYSNKNTTFEILICLWSDFLPDVTFVFQPLSSKYLAFLAGK